MNIFYGARGTGKTVNLIKYASENNLVLVCDGRRMVISLQDTAKILNLDILEPITYEEMLDKDCCKHAGNINGFAVDEIESFLDHVCGHGQLKALTLDINDSTKFTECKREDQKRNG